MGLTSGSSPFGPRFMKWFCHVLYFLDRLEWCKAYSTRTWIRKVRVCALVVFFCLAPHWWTAPPFTLRVSWVLCATIVLGIVRRRAVTKTRLSLVVLVVVLCCLIHLDASDNVGVSCNMAKNYCTLSILLSLSSSHHHRLVGT